MPLLSNTTTTTSTTTPRPFLPQEILLPSPPQHMDILTPQQELFKRQRRPYQIPLLRSQSVDRTQPSSLARTPSLPSLSPSDFSSYELFPAILTTPKGKSDPPAGKKKPKSAGGRKTVNKTNSAGCGFVLCRTGSRWGLPASKSTKAAAELRKGRELECF